MRRWTKRAYSVSWRTKYHNGGLWWPSLSLSLSMARPVESVESTGPASDSLEPPSESHACSEATSCPISRAAFAITRTDEALGPTSVSTPSNPAIAAFASAFGFASGFGFGLASGFGFGVASGLGGRPCLWFHLLRILLSYRYLWRPCRHPWCPFPRPFLFPWPSPPWGFLDTLKDRQHPSNNRQAYRCKNTNDPSLLPPPLQQHRYFEQL